MKKILTFPNPILTTRCDMVDLYRPHELKNAKNIISHLYATANNNFDRCLGLSANQLGFNSRIFVMRQACGPFFHVVNPVIVAMTGGVKRQHERCLSRVGKDGLLKAGISVRRAKQIKVECYTCHGKEWCKETFNLKGLDARVFQHELDHLNGVEI
jgi:peptide deformylase